MKSVWTCTDVPWAFLGSKMTNMDKQPWPCWWRPSALFLARIDVAWVELATQTFWSYFQAEGDLSEAWRTIQELQGFAVKSRRNVLSPSLRQHEKPCRSELTLHSHDDFRRSCRVVWCGLSKKESTLQEAQDLCVADDLKLLSKVLLEAGYSWFERWGSVAAGGLLLPKTWPRPAISRCSFECSMRLWSRLRRLWWPPGSWAISLVNGRPMPFWVRSGTRFVNVLETKMAKHLLAIDVGWGLQPQGCATFGTKQADCRRCSGFYL